MSPAIDTARRGLRAGVVALMLALVPALGIAGGLGMAPVVAVVGIVAVGVGLGKPGAEREPPGLWFVLVLAFALWAAVTSLWSVYPAGGVVGSNAAKLVFGVVAYTAAVAAMVHAARRAPSTFQTLALASAALIAGFAAIDAFTGYGLSLAVDPLEAGRDPNLRLADAEMNLGHGLTLGLLMMGPAMVGARARWADWRGWAFALALPSAVFAASWRIGLDVGVLGVLAVGAALVAARLVPRVAVGGVFMLGALAVALAPGLSLWAASLSPAAKAALPFSTEHRVEGWAHVGERIFERPLLGHGFDAVRTFDATKTMRGFEMEMVSLHPHNAGLHIWVETGVVGVVLAILALAALARFALAWVGSSRPRAQAVAAVTTAAVLISSVSYGVWQEWWWASLFFAAGFAALATREVGRA